MELAFQNVPFRNFQFEFDFAPKNVKEVESVNKIMQLFKFHMLPDVSNEKYMITPSEFQISYFYRDKKNDYMPKISRCVLTDMSLDYAPEKIRVTAICPGTFNTPMVTNSISPDTDFDQAIKGFGEAHPFGRIGDPEEIGHAVSFLSSNKAGFVTGEYLVVDGGMMARGAWDTGDQG